MFDYHDIKNIKLEFLKKIKQDIINSVNTALQEDLGITKSITQDITTSTTIHQKKQNSATIITNNNGIFCGQAWVTEIFLQLENKVNINWKVQDGEKIKKNQTVCYLHGPTTTLLAGERTVLNFIQILCGVASTVKKYIDILSNTTITLLDTRKTLPGLRTAQKYAVMCGGGKNHRMNLYESFLIKENHIIAAGSITKAIHNINKLHNKLPIEIEVENIQEMQEGIKAGADIIMLDNFSIKEITKAISLAKNQVKLEISGNINLKNIKHFLLPGIDYISIGALTKDIKTLDISMRLNNLNKKI